ncbi:hypothetical protein N007_13630 [Alicyclobacillus acidoterrestris ATCC 49025]|nr:hypothetical protein N007_13630 [Alicyclobacillus acidoterrestris ATCC 49025]
MITDAQKVDQLLRTDPDSFKHLFSNIPITPRMKFQFIEDHRDEFRVEKMCEVLSVSRSGYYKWRQVKQNRARGLSRHPIPVDIFIFTHEKDRTRRSLPVSRRW